MADHLTVFSYLGTVLFALALLPQAVRTFQLGHAYDISVLFLITVLGASASMLVWSLSLPNHVVAAGFVVNLFVWGYVLKVRLRPREDPGARGPDIP